MIPSDPSDARTRRRHRLTFWSLTVPVGLLVAALLALAAGAPRARWAPVAGFLGVTAVAAIYFHAGMRAGFRRAYRLRNSEVPWDVRLTRPLWLSLVDVLMLVGAGAILGAICAAVGFPSVGLGVMLTLGGFAASFRLVDIGMSPAD